LELLATKAAPRAHKDDVYHWLRARALGALGRHAEALEACDQALRINVRIYPAYIQRAESLYELARYDEALQNLGYALHPSRQQAEVYALRAKIYAAMGQPEASEAEAQQAAELAGVNR
jgi:tetratricopeptide (TPR) repeat protein